jgi:F-type H+-transporting ATPase subunit delta
MKRKQQASRDARQLFRLCLVDGLLDENRVRRVVELICGSRNRNRFDVLSQFRRLVRLDSAQHTATVESVAPLSAEFQADVQARLLQMYGQGMSVSFATNPTLIGGLRIAAGSDVYDGSVRARLAALEATFE